MALRVDTHKRVVNLVIPKRAILRSAYMFALEHQYWIQQKVAEMPETIDYVDGAKIKILGQSVTIQKNTLCDGTRHLQPLGKLFL